MTATTDSVPADKLPGENIPALCQALQELQTRRKFFIKLAVRQSNALGALARRMLGFRNDLPEREREKIRARATKLCAAALAGKPPARDDAEIVAVLAAEFAAAHAALAPIEQRRAEIEKAMIKLARRLPAFGFVKAIRGFGDLAFAILVGETGDLANYRRWDLVWKRLGLAPYNGQAYSRWRAAGGLSAEEWIAAGYKGARLAEVFSALSEPLAKHQLQSAEKSGTDYGAPLGRYGEIYVSRRAETATRCPDWSKGHARMDALRKMVKAVIRDLWRAWTRGGTVRDSPARGGQGIPAAA